MDFTQLHIVTNRNVNLPIGNTTWQWKIQHLQMIIPILSEQNGTSISLDWLPWPTQSFKYLGLIRKGSSNWSATWAAQPGFYEQKVEAWLPFEELCGFDMLWLLKLKHIETWRCVYFKYAMSTCCNISFATVVEQEASLKVGSVAKFGRDRMFDIFCVYSNVVNPTINLPSGMVLTTHHYITHHT